MNYRLKEPEVTEELILAHLDPGDVAVFLGGQGGPFSSLLLLFFSHNGWNAQGCSTCVLGAAVSVRLGLSCMEVSPSL